MLTGAIRNQVDQIWNTFWSGGVSNPLSVIEQITYLLFAKRLDDLHTAREAQANLLGEKKIENPIFMKKQDHLRWSRFKDFEPQRKFEVFRDEVFPKDIICDPACGTCGYLVAAAEYLEHNHKDILRCWTRSST